jgi:hypothetical protein
MTTVNTVAGVVVTASRYRKLKEPGGTGWSVADFDYVDPVAIYQQTGEIFAPSPEEGWRPCLMLSTATSPSEQRLMRRLAKTAEAARTILAKPDSDSVEYPIALFDRPDGSMGHTDLVAGGATSGNIHQGSLPSSGFQNVWETLHNHPKNSHAGTDNNYTLYPSLARIDPVTNLPAGDWANFDWVNDRIAQANNIPASDTGLTMAILGYYPPTDSYRLHIYDGSDRSQSPSGVEISVETVICEDPGT